MDSGRDRHAAIPAAVFGLCAGTRIAIPGAEIPVEALFDGELVIACGGEMVPLRSIAKRRFDLRRSNDADRVHPVRICAGAFADGLPTRDLLLAPDNRLRLGDITIEARLLVNGTTITRVSDADVVTYFQIELERPECFFAEGLPTAGELDAFGLGGDSGRIGGTGLAHWHARPDEQGLRDSRQLIFARAAELGFTRTHDPALSVSVGGQIIRPSAIEWPRYVIPLPRGTSSFHLMSRAAVAREILTDSSDRRLLGICVSRLRVVDRDRTETLELAAQNRGGFHALEHNASSAWRWTNGDATVHCDPVGDGASLHVEIGATHLYWEHPEHPARAAEIAGQSARVSSSRLFDAAWYRETYPGIVASARDPAFDYVTTGAARGRNPGPDFDTGFYLDRNPDVAAANINPLLHYDELGAAEGRTPRPAREMQDRYIHWVRKYDTLSDQDRDAIRAHIRALRRRPVISVVMPVYNAPEHLLREAIGSVLAQLYPHWELCIADDASPSPHVRRVLESLACDSRVKITFRTTNGHISAASNSALALAGGEFIALMDHDDLLSPRALYEIAAELDKHPDADVIYSDEDTLDTSGRRCLAYFKPDWNFDLFLSHNVVSHLGVYRRSLLDRAGGFRLGFEGSQDYDLTLRATALTTAERIRHIPAVLYHWRRDSETPSFSATWQERCAEAARRAIAERLADAPYPACAAKIEPAPRAPLCTRVRYPLPDPPPAVSLIVATRDRLDLLEPCLAGLLYGTDYPRIELIVVDNDSREPATKRLLRELRADDRARVIRVRGAFNYSALNNRAVRQASGEIVVLLNNDVSVIDGSWLSEMVSHALRPEVGAVGAKLLYANRSVQHGGVVLGCQGVAGHYHRGAAAGDGGYFGHLLLQRATSAVTGACLAIRRDLFLEVGGLDETNLAVSYNDIDLCLRLRRRGLRIVWTPFAELRHIESASRGPDDAEENRERAQRETAYMLETWGAELAADPLYNPNLGLETGHCDLAFPPRRPNPWRGHAPDGETGNADPASAGVPLIEASLPRLSAAD